MSGSSSQGLHVGDERSSTQDRSRDSEHGSEPSNIAAEIPYLDRFRIMETGTLDGYMVGRIER